MKRDCFVGFLATNDLREHIRREAAGEKKPVSQYLYELLLRHFQLPDETNPPAEELLRGE